MDDLITWLRAALDEDERVARTAGGEHWPDSAHEMWTNELVHVRRHDPARVLAEVDAKRRILALHDGDHECSTIRRGVDAVGVAYEEIDNCTWVIGGDCSTVRLLALPLADREGYREEWRP